MNTYSLKVSSKSMTGHLLGAAGVETIFSTLAIHEGVLPPTINLNKQDPECDLDYVVVKRKRWISNTYAGFGGTSSALVLKKPSQTGKEELNVSPNSNELSKMDKCKSY